MRSSMQTSRAERTTGGDGWGLVAARQRAEHVAQAAHHTQPAVAPLLCGRRVVVASRLFGRKGDRATRRLAPEPASVHRDFFEGL
jgi:hypothetical protein